ncbi:MAG: 4-hydroxybutyrate CoA-transferase, partial [Candidatus Nanopelagicaceae bacterium]
MRVINYEQLRGLLAGHSNPRIVASGNFAPPKTLLQAANESIETFKLNMLNAHPGIPDREGIS